MIGTMITHRMIEAFRAVVQGGSVTRAADMLNISQPSVSRLLSDLEARIGLRLFERRGTRLSATPAGLELFDEVDRSFLALSRIEHTAAQIRDRASGSLTVAAMSGLGYSLLPDLLGKLRRAGAPPIRLHVVPSQTALSMLASRQADLAFAAIPPSTGVGRQLAMFSLEAQVILPAGHALTRASGPLRPVDLAPEPMVALVAGSLPRIETDRAFASEGVQPRTSIETMQAHSAAQLVRAGLGFAIVDPMTAAAHVAQGGVARLFRPSLDMSFGAYSWHQPEEGGWISRLITSLSIAIDSYALHQA
jgi:DNA-binding transcriptional LysR family regulator